LGVSGQTTRLRCGLTRAAEVMERVRQATPSAASPRARYIRTCAAHPILALCPLCESGVKFFMRSVMAARGRRATQKRVRKSRVGSGPIN
jgi:hypothetical protein